MLAVGKGQTTTFEARSGRHCAMREVDVGSAINCCRAGREFDNRRANHSDSWRRLRLRCLAGVCELFPLLGAVGTFVGVPGASASWPLTISRNMSMLTTYKTTFHELTIRIVGRYAVMTKFALVALPTTPLLPGMTRLFVGIPDF